MGIAPDASGAHSGAAADDIRGHHHQLAGLSASTARPARDEPRRTIGACAGITGSSCWYVAAATQALCFALRAYLFRPEAGAPTNPGRRAGRAAFRRGRATRYIGPLPIPRSLSA